MRRPQRCQLLDLLNNPEALANAVWGPPLEGSGNTQPNDGWVYRSRGIYQIVGREQYSRVNNATCLSSFLR